jgi:PhnB protein
MSERRYKPEKYPDLSPYLIANGAQSVIDFLKDVFGASDLRRYEDPKGGLLHAEVKVGDSVVMIADGNEQWPGVLCHIHVYVLDVDAVFQKAVAAGAEVIQEPKTREGDPDKRGGFKDPSGNSWWVSTQTN